MTTRHARAAIRWIAANVRSLRIEQGLTQEALAERADIEKSYLQKIERGVPNLSVESLVTLADALQVTPARLFEPAEMQPRAVGRPRRRPGVAK